MTVIAVSKRAGIVVAATIVAFLVGECAIRLAAPALPVPLRAFVEVEARAQAITALRVANRSRIILREADFEAAPGAIVVGDSMVFGSMVEANQAFPALLSREGGPRALNLGVPGAGPHLATSMVEWAMEQLPEAPERVLYGFFANDFLQAGPDEPRREAEEAFVWAAEADSDFGLELRHAREWLFGRSVFYRMAKNLLSMGTATRTWESAEVRTVGEGAGAFVFVTPEYWRRHLSLERPEIREGFTAALAEVLGARDAATRAGSSFAVILIPFKEQIQLPSLIEAGRAPVDLRDPCYDSTYDLFARRLGEDGVEVIDPRPAFRAAAAGGERLFFTVDGHLTPRGHELLAERVNARADGGTPETR